MAFMCPVMDEMERNRAAVAAISKLASDLKADYQCFCEYVPPAPPSSQTTQVCTCEGCCCPCVPKKVEPEPCDPPPVMVCYKVSKGRKAGKSKQIRRGQAETAEKKETVHRLTQSKSRELRAGIMYVGCDCEKRNGLQDDCQRTECHGSPGCLTQPDPICGPSEFANGKHLAMKYKMASGQAGSGGDLSSGAGYGGDGLDAGEEDYEYHCFPASIRPPDMTDAVCLCRS